MRQGLKATDRDGGTARIHAGGSERIVTSLYSWPISAIALNYVFEAGYTASAILSAQFLPRRAIRCSSIRSRSWSRVSRLSIRAAWLGVEPPPLGTPDTEIVDLAGYHIGLRPARPGDGVFRMPLSSTVSVTRWS